MGDEGIYAERAGRRAKKAPVVGRFLVRRQTRFQSSASTCSGSGKVSVSGLSSPRRVRWLRRVRRKRKARGRSFTGIAYQGLKRSGDPRR